MPKPRFCVIVPSWNAGRTIEGCLASIYAQDYRDFMVVAVDDASTDPGDFEAMKQAVEKHRRFGVPTLVAQRPRNGGGLASIIDATTASLSVAPFDRPDTIMVQVDGDDELASRNVLEMLAGVYGDDPTRCLMTFGQYRTKAGLLGHCQAYDPETVHANTYRTAPWYASHVKTWRRGLWDSVPPEYFTNPDTGLPWRLAVDQCTMIPMLERSGGRWAFVDEVLYLYNDTSPYNAFRMEPENEMEHVNRHRSMPVLRPWTGREWERVMSGTVVI